METRKCKGFTCSGSLSIRHHSGYCQLCGEREARLRKAAQEELAELEDYYLKNHPSLHVTQGEGRGRGSFPL